MNPGPLGRLAGAIGLLVLAPTAVLLVRGVITPADAAVRALATFVAVLVIARIAKWWLTALAGTFESDADGTPAGHEDGQNAAPRRRKSDQVNAGAESGAGQ